MEWMPIAFGVSVVVALSAGAVAVWLAVDRGRALARLASALTERDAAGAELSQQRDELDRLRGEVREYAVRVEGFRKDIEAAEARRRELLEAVEREKAELRQRYQEREAELRGELSERFKAASAEAMKLTTDEFLKLARESFSVERAKAEKAMGEKQAAIDQLVAPIRDTLAKTGERLEKYEDRRAESFAKLAQQINDIGSANMHLRQETSKLVKALSKPEVRGRYGEIQLRRVAELAGMTAYCDFSEQASSRDGDGRLLRPDMVVRLPNERVVAVDAKTNTYAYLEAVSAETPEAREKHLERFARHVAEQAQKLGQKHYWAEMDGSVDFVVMFVPGDHFLDAALERRPDLLDLAAEHRVIMATPSTLIGLLRAVHVGWREKTLADEANELFALGRELHDRAVKALEHAGKLGDTLRKAVEHYNRFTGSVDARLMPTLRKFEEVGAKTGKEIPAAVEVTVTPRLLEAVSGVGGAGAGAGGGGGGGVEGEDDVGARNGDF